MSYLKSQMAKAYGYEHTPHVLDWPMTESYWENGLPNIEVWVDIHIQWTVFSMYWPQLAFCALFGRE